MVVLGDGEHHNDNATDAIGDFLGDRDRIHSLRLHPHTETNEEAAKGNSAARALIGRAAGEPYRPLKKLELRSSRSAILGAIQRVRTGD